MGAHMCSWNALQTRVARIYPFYATRSHSCYRWGWHTPIQHYQSRSPQIADHRGKILLLSALKPLIPWQPFRSAPLLILINKSDLQFSCPEYLTDEKLRRDLDLTTLEDQGLQCFIAHTTIRDGRTLTPGLQWLNRQADEKAKQERMWSTRGSDWWRFLTLPGIDEYWYCAS